MSQTIAILAALLLVIIALVAHARIKRGYARQDDTERLGRMYRGMLFGHLALTLTERRYKEGYVVTLHPSGISGNPDPVLFGFESFRDALDRLAVAEQKEDAAALPSVTADPGAQH